MSEKNPKIRAAFLIFQFERGYDLILILPPGMDIPVI